MSQREITAQEHRTAGAMCVPSPRGWMDGKEEDLARHMRPRLLLAEREDVIR